jgi:hypothetical protein
VSGYLAFENQPTINIFEIITIAGTTCDNNGRLFSSA